MLAVYGMDAGAVGSVGDLVEAVMSIEARLANIAGVVSVKAEVIRGNHVFWLETDVPMPLEGEKFLIGFSGTGRDEEFDLAMAAEAVARARENPKATLESFRERKRSQAADDAR